MFVVVVTSGTGAFRGRVGGLELPLRIVLSAQRCGATAVHLDGDARALAPRLVDERVRIPIEIEPPPLDAITIECASDVLVHPDAFRALAESLADGRARMLGHGEAHVVARPAESSRTSLGPPVPLVFAQPYAFPPMRIDSLGDAVRGNTALLRSCRKPSDGWTSRHLNRLVSLALTRLLLHTGVRPNHVTIAIVSLGIASGIVAARGTHDSFVLGAGLLQLQSMLDGCDGELARMTFRQSTLGEWLDTIGDDLSNYAFFAGAAVGTYRASGHWGWLLLGAVLVGCGAIASAIEYRYLARKGTGDLLAYPIAGSTGRTAALQPLFKRDTFILLTFVAAVFSRLPWALVASTIGAIAVLVTVLRTEARLARQA